MVSRKTLREADFKRINKKLDCRGCIFAVTEELERGPCCAYPGQIVPTQAGCPGRTGRVLHPAARQGQSAQQVGPQRITAGIGRR